MKSIAFESFEESDVVCWKLVVGNLRYVLHLQSSVLYLESAFGYAARYYRTHL